MDKFPQTLHKALNKGPYPFPGGDYSKISKIHKNIYLLQNQWTNFPKLCTKHS